MPLFLKNYIDNHPVSIVSIARHYQLNSDTLQKQYKDSLSDFRHWDQLSHASDWLLFPENIGKHLGLDETALSDGEVYTILTNKAGHGRKGTLVAMIKGTKAENAIAIFKQLSRRLRYKVKEVTVDFANNMAAIVRQAFPWAKIVNDRFHLHQLVYDAVQDIRIKYRWQVMEEENMKQMEAGNEYRPVILPNGDTLKQLLARSRYLLYKPANRWSLSQKERAVLLFERYPEIKQAYSLAMQLALVFKAKSKEGAYTKLARWYEKVERKNVDYFKTISNTIYNHYDTILNYFDHKATNTAAENFNAKIKAFRNAFRGIKDIKFFLFRLAKIYA